MSDRMRITGMVSGMDTESIVQQLVAVKQKKVDDLKNDQKKLEWKQNAWQDLNTKIYNFYSGTLSKLRLSSAFKKQKTTVSDTTKASVTASGSAVNGMQTLQIKEIAKQGYLTGAKLNSNIKYNSSNNIMGISNDLVGQRIKVTANTTLEEGTKYKYNDAGEIVLATKEEIAMAEQGLMNLRTADGSEKLKVTSEIKFTEDMTIQDFVGELKNAGVNASFDETYQRFYISAKETGKENDFTIENLPTSLSDGAPMGNALELLGLDPTKTITYEDGSTATASRIDGQDAKIVLNGAEYTSASNSFEINGLNIMALNKTADDEEITINTVTDVDAAYNVIKEFLTEYNELINEMDKLYNADSARKYNMLSADDKEAMTDDEVETWEGTIKGSLLRKDTQLSAVISALTNGMMSGATIGARTTYVKGQNKDSDELIEIKEGGKQMYLSDFGIKTLGYFNAKDNEHHAYYIDGDPDVDSVSGKDDKLRKALQRDPEGTADFFAGLCKNLYTALDKTMSTSTDYSSIYKVYNDKQLKKDYDNYSKKIKEAEKKLSAYEDKWYDKFSKMETALSKLQSNQSIVSSMFGN